MSDLAEYGVRTNEQASKVHNPNEMLRAVDTRFRLTARVLHNVYAIS
jgi:hypothetical protein